MPFVPRLFESSLLPSVISQLIFISISIFQVFPINLRTVHIVLPLALDSTTDMAIGIEHFLGWNIDDIEEVLIAFLDFNLNGIHFYGIFSKLLLSQRSA